MSSAVQERSFVLIPLKYPLGLPLYWRDEITGELARVVMMYLRQEELSKVQFDLFKSYLIHYIHAPCWMGNGVLEQLRKLSHKLSTKEEIEGFLNHCLKIGLDPL